MSLVRKAYHFAVKAHAGVSRKWSGEPYVEHPVRVAAALARLGFPEKVVAAALLHDVVEDTPVSAAEIAAEFGEDVAALVMEVTKPVMCRASTTKLERKAAFRKHLVGSSFYGASIKLSDMADNSRNVAEMDSEFAAVYLPELRKDVAVLGHGHPKLLAKVKRNLGIR